MAQATSTVSNVDLPEACNMLIQQPQPLILASQSQSRQALLAKTGLVFECIPANIDERSLQANLQSLSVLQQAVALAKAKAAKISALYPNAVVIGADQICECEGRIFGKPGTAEKALEQLTFLQNKTHQLHTGLVLFQQERCLWQFEDTARLNMRALSAQQLQFYIDQEQPLYACGSYHIEGLGLHLFDEVEGDQDCIQGLPVMVLLKALRDFS